VRSDHLLAHTEEGNTISTHSGWGDIFPDKFADFLKYEEKLSENAHRMYRFRWKQLVQENAPPPGGGQRQRHQRRGGAV
jgi:hypothetical protein